MKAPGDSPFGSEEKIKRYVIYECIWLFYQFIIGYRPIATQCPCEIEMMGFTKVFFINMWILLPDMHANRDSMLKEKFWIDEDEPISEEILVTSLQAAQEEEEEQQQVMGEVGGWGGEGSTVHHAHTAAQPKKKGPREMLCQVRHLIFLNHIKTI